MMAFSVTPGDQSVRFLFPHYAEIFTHSKFKKLVNNAEYHNWLTEF